MRPVTPSTSEPGAARHDRPVRLRDLRLQRGLTQKQVAWRSGLHRNSIRKIESGMTREIGAENANALAGALGITVQDLGLRVRPPVPAHPGPASIRLRKLTPEQRRILEELLSLPPADYTLLRMAMEHLRQ